VASSNLTWHAGQVTRADRARASGTRGATVWLTGLSGSGKSTLAVEIERRLVASGRSAYRLDGDNLRSGLSEDLGFGQAAREENCRRIAEVACLFADAGLVAIVAVISPYASSRQRARALHEKAGLPFVEVYLSASATECASRDAKGLYAQAATGDIEQFTGVDAPYEVPQSPEIVIGAERPLEYAADLVLDALDGSTGEATALS
jgi:adenylyl-sulfate kinase